MSEKLPELSVFFPSYDEEDNIEETVKKAGKVLPNVAKKWEIIIVNDGSADRTGEIAARIAKGNKNIRVVDHKKNKGYGAAFKSGFYSAKYKWITFTDADGQFNFSEIKDFIKTQRETKADLVIGYYRKRGVTVDKIITSKMWEYLVYFMFGLKVRDIDCGFKFVSKDVIDALPKLESERGAFISSEFLIKAKKKGFNLVEIPVTHYPRAAGEGTGRDLNVIMQSFRDLFKLWKKLR